MKNLFDIIEGCKTNGRPDYDELRYSVLVLTSLLNMDHQNLFECLTRDKEYPAFIKKMKADNSFKMYKTALNKSPKEYLGWNNDPENPEYQKFHAMGSRLVDKVLGKVDNR